MNAAWAFAPDGTALIVRYGTDDAGVIHRPAARRLARHGRSGRGEFDFVDVQRLAP